MKHGRLTMKYGAPNAGLDIAGMHTGLRRTEVMMQKISGMFVLFITVRLRYKTDELWLFLLALV